MSVRLGISTCPNDTFAFHALLTGRVRPAAGLDLSIELRDVQELNERLAAGMLDAAKVSYHAALLAADRWCMLPVGSALGFGVGPLLLAAAGRTSAPAPRSAGPANGTSELVLCPGAGTTAALLYDLFHPGAGRVTHVVFSEILPRLQRGDADFGVCIHEGRFTYPDFGLTRVEDLGATWEAATGLPLPLGGIAVRRDLGADTHRALTATVRASLEYALAHRDETLPTMRRHAQELSADTLWSHVELYVNAWTLDLGPEGRAAVAELGRRAREAGIVPRGRPALEVASEERRLFHVAPADRWSPARTADWTPPSLASEGFVHLSFAEQLAGTLAAHFRGAPPQRLLELRPAALADALRIEPARDQALFPHLYRPLRDADVLRWWPLERRGETWTLPRLAARAEDDEPQGTAPVSGC